MERRNILRTLIFAIPSLLSVGATTVTQRFTLEYLYLGPIYTNKNNKSRILLKLSTNTGTFNNKLVNFYVYNESHKTGANIANLRVNNADGTLDTTFTTYSFDTGKTNQVKFFFVDSDGKRSEFFFDAMFDDTQPNITVEKYSGNTYQAQNVRGYQKNRGNFNTTDKYVFSNAYIDLGMNVYNKFDVSKLAFEEYFGLIRVPITNSTFKLEMPANPGLFNDLTSSEISSNKVSFNINLVNNGSNKYSMSFANKLYVDPVSYQMSRHGGANYVETKHIFLPKNGLSENEKLNFKLSGNQLGQMRLSFVYNFSLIPNIKRIGDCVSTEYCIRAEDAYYSEVGKELTHD